MSCSTHRRRGVTRDLLSVLLLFHVFLMILSLTLAEEIDNQKMALVRTMNQRKKSMCLRQLESTTSLEMLLRMYVRPIGPGNNRLHIAGSVKVPTEELEVGGDRASLHYEYTSLDKELYLNVTLNGKPLRYITTRFMYHLRYDLNAVKMYVKGRVEILDGEECSQPETTTTTTTTVMVSSQANHAESFSKEHRQHDDEDTIQVPLPADIPSSPAASTMPGSGDTTSWIMVMGAAGPVPLLVIVVVLLVLLVVVVVSVSVILWRRRKAADNTSKNKDEFAACQHPLMPQTTNIGPSMTSQADQFSSNDMNVNPVYRSPPPPPSLNYYSE
ncbi:uncharacterized protein LOC135109760 [Scylla paramamosain]|uniref:uncharacterized protein LOC135109760 n=1 Tax=Scylla paramamosain TaxID=85552 RepID=UPI003082B756